MHFEVKLKVYKVFALFNTLDRLTICCKQRDPGSCKIFRAWVEVLTQHTVFFLQIKFFGNARQMYFLGIFCELLVYHKGILLV